MNIASACIKNKCSITACKLRTSSYFDGLLGLFISYSYQKHEWGLMEKQMHAYKAIKLKCKGEKRVR